MIRLLPLGLVCLLAGCASGLPDGTASRVVHTLTVTVGAGGATYEVEGEAVPGSIRLPGGTSLAVRLVGEGEALVVAAEATGETGTGLAEPRVVRLGPDRPSGALRSPWVGTTGPTAYDVVVFACAEAGGGGPCARWAEVPRWDGIRGLRVVAGGAPLPNESQFVPSREDPPLEPDGPPAP